MNNFTSGKVELNGLSVHAEKLRCVLMKGNSAFRSDRICGERSAIGCDKFGGLKFTPMKVTLSCLHTFS